MTIEEFGKTIQAKYPQYSSLPAVEVGQKMLAKYPEYQSAVSGPTQKAAPKVDAFLSGHPVLKGISDFVGTTGLGKGIAQGIFLKFTPEGKNLLNLVSQGQIKQEDVENIIGKTATTKEILGSAIGAATTIGGFGLKAVKGGSALSRIGKASAQLGGLGAISGGAGALQNNGDTGDILRGAMLGGTIGAAVGGTLQAGGEILKGISKNVPKSLYNTSIKPTLDENRRAIKYGGKTLGEKLLDRGVVGSDKALLKKSLTNLEANESALQGILKGQSDKMITRAELSTYLDDIINVKNATPGLADDVEGIRRVLYEFPESVTLEQANAIKRNLYTALRDVSFKLDPSLSTKKEAMKGLAKGIKSEIEKKVGGETVKKLNQELSVYGRLYDRIVDKLARSQRNNLLGLGDFGAGILGGAASGGLGVPGAIVGKKIIGSTAMKTGAGLTVKKISDLVNKLPTDVSGKISKTALLKLIEALNREN